MQRLITILTLAAVSLPSQAGIHIVNNIGHGESAVLVQPDKKQVAVYSATFSTSGCAPTRQVLKLDDVAVTSELSLPTGSTSGTGGSFTLNFNPPLLVKPHSSLTATNGDQVCQSNIMIQSK